MRDVRGMTQQELSDATGIGRPSISDIENGHRYITIGEAVAICETLGVPLASMVSPDRLVISVDVPVDPAP